MSEIDPPPSQGNVIASFTSELDHSFADEDIHGNCQMVDELRQQLHTLEFLLQRNFESCEVKWAFFVAAALSYRYDAQLRPYPTYFAPQAKGCDIERMFPVIKDTPRLDNVLRLIREQKYDQLYTAVIRLLHWVLTLPQYPEISLVDDIEFEELMCKLGHAGPLLIPTAVFYINREDKPFKELCKRFRTGYAFHSSQLSNFYSIVCNGFREHTVNVLGLPDEIVTLKTDLGACLKHSLFYESGAIHCLALCKYVVNPEHVEQKRDGDHPSNTDILINNGDLIRLRCLLFYDIRHPITKKSLSVMRKLTIFTKNHRPKIALACYIAVMISISFITSRKGQNLRKTLIGNGQRVLDFCRGFYCKSLGIHRLTL